MVLAEQAFSELEATLSAYGSSLSPDARIAIHAVLTTMEAGLRGELRPSFYLSAIDPGTGKSLAVALFLKAYKNAGFLPASGVLVCVSRLAEIDTYLAAAGLERDEVAVLTGDEQLNALGAPEALHDQAPVMFTTQQRIEARGAQATMKDLPSLFFQGRPRALRIWDESLLLGSAKTLKVDDLGGLLAPLRVSKPQTAAAVQSLMMAAWGGEPGGVLTIPPALSSNWGRTATPDAATALMSLAGAEVRVVDLGGDLRLAGAAQAMPIDFAPAIILDASGRVRETYRLWEDRVGNLERLPAAQNDYRDMVLHLWRRASGSRTLDDAKARKDIAKAIAEKVAERPTEEWLVVHYKGASVLLDEVRRLVGLEVADRIHGLTWGRHHGTNAYAHVPNIVIVGHLNYGSHGYEAVAAAAIGNGKVATLTSEELEALRAGEAAHNLLQAVCRSNSRKARNGVAGPCQVYVCISKIAGLDVILERCFPGHQRQAWAPQDREELKGRNGDVVRYLAQRFGTTRGLIIQKNEVAAALGIKATALSRCLSAEAVQDMIDELEIQVRRNSFTRPVPTFAPYPSGTFVIEDLISKPTVRQ